MNPAPGRSGTPSRFDSTFFRGPESNNHHHIPVDLQSQATYSSGIPAFAANGGPYSQVPRNGVGAKRHPYGGYASSVISQDVGSAVMNDGSSVVGAPVRAGNMAFSQSDRLRRRLSQSSMGGASDLGSLSTFDYKSQDDAVDLDDVRSQYSHSQAGVTEF